ncbi:MAG: PAS/PAC sensor signal transduction histidine kinase, partial [Actinobacteria bacterium]|nr:PAS/PAC sensor signal transduction histidine kinase [Actinomycetota bacterium]
MSMPAPKSRGMLTDSERAKRRRERLAIGIVAILVVGLTLLEANLTALGGSVVFGGNIIIFALINLNIVLIVLLIFLVTRNLFKVILDRKRNILGAKIRSRLVLIFIGFSLAPTILLFVAAANITTTSIKSWIGGRVGVALTGALEMARGRLEWEAGQLSGVADEAAARMPRKASGAKAGKILARIRKVHPEGTTLILADRKGIVASSGDASAGVSEEILSRLKGIGFSERSEKSTTLVGDVFASAVRKLPDGRVIIAIKTLPKAETQKIREIAKAYDEYQQVRLLDDPIRTSYIAVLILITLLIVFAASWMGIHLAKQITVPVQMLAEGTEKVAGGDLDVRLDYRSDDEFGHLVSSFNRMTGDLKEMKRHLEEANLSLSSTFEELRRRTQFIETILTNISTGVVVIDRHNRIAMINKVAEGMLGIKAEAVIGKPYKEVTREEHFEAIRALTREVGGEAGRQVERQIDLPVGARKVSLRVSVTVLHDVAGEYIGLVVAFDDLSQAMRLQKVLAWREVARRIAHEIRNPLTPIQLSTERMEKKYGAVHEGDPAFAECTQTILSEVANLKHLVEEFTRFARMPAPVFKEGNLPEELRSVVETSRAAHPGIAWEFDAKEIPPAWFDPFQVRRAVSNLLENAAAALGGKGTVKVVCVHEPELGRVRITVADDGPGIPADDRDRLFEPYFSRKEGGTGLGLAIVSAIASDHG